MRVLVTGGTGFVGSHLLDELVFQRDVENKNLEIFATRRYHLSRRDKVEHLESKVNWVDSDITDSISTNNLINSVKPDWCFHMAAESFVSPSWLHPRRYMEVNYVGTLNLLESIKNFQPGCRILIPGSGEEYGKIDFSDLPITKKTALKPVNPYAVTKIAQDLIGLVYFESYGINVIRLRTFNHEGPRRERYFGISSFCFQIARIEAGLQNPEIKVGHLNDLRNFTHVKDIVAAYTLAMQKSTPGNLYLVGTENKENVATFDDVLKRLISKSSYKGNITISESPDFVRPTQVPYLLADTKEFTELTGWKAKFDLDYILNDVLEYWRKRIKTHPEI